MLNRTKLHLSVTKAAISFIIYNFMGKFNKNNKSLPLYHYSEGKTDVFCFFVNIIMFSFSMGVHRDLDL